MGSVACELPIKTVKMGKRVQKAGLLNPVIKIKPLCSKNDLHRCQQNISYKRLNKNMTNKKHVWHQHSLGRILCVLEFQVKS